jgi:16S rRNA (uracil1498-N3)-methyltransferase
VQGFAADAPAVAHTFVDALDDDLVVAGDDGHHLARVRRLRRGEPVTAADGKGVWRPYIVSDTGSGRVGLHACGAAVVEPGLAPGLAVAFALTKGTKPDLVVQKLTELGSDRILPVRSRRSMARWERDRSTAAVERLRRVAREAAAQCRRALLPEIGEPAPLESLAGRPGLLVADRGGWAASELAEPPDDGWVLVIGPEGGLTSSEQAALGSPPALGVGPYVLRAETAAIAGAAALAGRRRPRSASGAQ